MGQSIEIPLAVTRSLNRWIYDVVAEEVLQFPFGAVATFHVKPRREATGGRVLGRPGAGPGGGVRGSGR